VGLLIGSDVSEPLRAVAPSPALPRPSGDLTSLRDQVLVSRPDLTAAIAAVEAARAEVDLVRAERFLPEIKVGVKYEQALDFDASSQRGLVTLSVPLPLWNRREGGLERAGAGVAKHQARVQLTPRRLGNETR